MNGPVAIPSHLRAASGQLRGRVLHVVRQYFPSRGGLEQHVHDLALLQSCRRPVYILTLDCLFGQKQKLPRFERHGRIVVIRVPFIGFARLFLPFISPALLRRFQLIHVHGLDQCADLVSLYRRFGGPPFVLTSHGLFFHTAALNRIKQLYFRTVSRLTLSRARDVFAVSEADRSRLTQIGIAAHHLRNPITPFPSRYRGGRDLVYVGRLAENKQVHRLVEFAAALRDLGCPHRLHIVGSGDRAVETALAAAIAAHRLDGLVRLHGFLERRVLAGLFRECGYTLSASRYEGFGMAVVEAMSAGLLPVLQPNDAFRAIAADSGCGLLADFDEPREAARRFLVWSGRQTQDARDRAASYASAQTWDAAADLVEASYLRALGPAEPKSAPAQGRGGTPALRRIAGVDIRVSTRTDALALLADRLARRIPTSVAFANANLIVKANEHPRGPALLDDMLVFNDGIGVDIAAKLLFGSKFPENLNGTDFTPALLASVPKATRVFLYGARPEVVRAAARLIEARFGVQVCGFRDGYGSEHTVAGEINASGADLVLVALGNPRQEDWIARNRGAISAPLVVAIGAWFDFLTGAVPRAPVWIQRLHLEWAYRLGHEPRRLARRYTIDMVRFLVLALRGARADRSGPHIGGVHA
jgi:alpha-1,3-mannosyltransferase